MIAYQGSLTDQLRKTAAIPSKVRSVTTALPFLKSKPPRAGNNARPSGAECQCEDSLLVSSPAFCTLGRSKSSVDERMDCLASSTDSERFELRLGLCGSAKVDARPSGRWWRGDMLALPVDWAIEPLEAVDPLVNELLSLVAIMLQRSKRHVMRKGDPSWEDGFWTGIAFVYGVVC